MNNATKSIRVGVSLALAGLGVILCRSVYACPSNLCPGFTPVEVTAYGPWPGTLYATYSVQGGQQVGDPNGGLINGNGTTLYVATGANASGAICVDGYVLGDPHDVVTLEVAGYGASNVTTAPPSPFAMYIDAIICGDNP